MPIARTPAQVIAGEAVSGTPQERFDDMVGIASVIANRQAQLGVTPKQVVSVNRQFNAYGQPLDKGRAAYVGLAQQAIDHVAANGPVHRGTFYATPEAFGKIGVKGLSKVAQTTGHIYAEDPQARAIETSVGFKTPNAQVAANVPTPAARPSVPGLAGIAPSLASYAPAAAAPSPRSALGAIAAAAPRAGPLAALSQGPLAARPSVAPASIRTAPTVNPLGFTSSPVAAETRVTSSFSPARKNPVDGRMRPHTGIDIAGMAPGAINKKDALSVRDGTVVKAGVAGGYGKQVVVDHGFGLTTSYNHLDSIGVKVGDKVAAADKIGAIGNTGRSTGPHTHFEARIDGKPVDPEAAISALGRIEDSGMPASTPRSVGMAPAVTAARAPNVASVAPRVATPTPSVARQAPNPVAVAASRPAIAAAPAARPQVARAAQPVQAQRAPAPAPATARAVAAVAAPAAKPAPAAKTVVGRDVTPAESVPTSMGPVGRRGKRPDAAPKTAPPAMSVVGPMPSTAKVAASPALTASVARSVTPARAVAAAPSLAASVAAKPTTAPAVAATPTTARAIGPVSTASVAASPALGARPAAVAAPAAKTVVGVDVTPATARAPVPSFSSLMAESQAQRAKAKVAAPAVASLPSLPAPKTVAQRQVAAQPAAVAAAPKTARAVASTAPAATAAAATSTGLGAPSVPDAPGFGSKLAGKIGNSISQNKGRMAGAVIGSALAGPLGAALGGALGNRVQKGMSPQPSNQALGAIKDGNFDGFSHGVNQNQGLFGGFSLGGLFGGGAAGGGGSRGSGSSSSSGSRGGLGSGNSTSSSSPNASSGNNGSSFGGNKNSPTSNNNTSGGKKK